MLIGHYQQGREREGGGFFLLRLTLTISSHYDPSLEERYKLVPGHLGLTWWTIIACSHRETQSSHSLLALTGAPGDRSSHHQTRHQTDLSLSHQFTEHWRNWFLFWQNVIVSNLEWSWESVRLWWSYYFMTGKCNVVMFYFTWRIYRDFPQIVEIIWLSSLDYPSKVKFPK